MDPLLEHSFFNSLAEELNKICLYPDYYGEDTWGGKWSESYFYFLSKISGGEAFSYSEQGCGDYYGKTCLRCSGLIDTKQKQLTERLKRVYNGDEMTSLKLEIESLNKKIDSMNKNFEERMKEVIEGMKKLKLQEE